MQNKGGIPMDEESLKDWQQAFIDIEESINGIYKENKKSDVSADTSSARKSKVKNKKPTK